MKFFIDTADVAEIRELAATGLLDGVTTNPSLIAKAKRDFREVIAEICALVGGPVSAEVTALDAPQMIAEGRSLAKIARYHGPLLQFHGDADTIIPFALAERLYAAANQPKQFVVIPGADHNDPLSPRFYEALDEFLDRLSEAR